MRAELHNLLYMLGGQDNGDYGEQVFMGQCPDIHSSVHKLLTAHRPHINLSVSEVELNQH